MPELTYALKVHVITDAITRAREVGAYQSYEWLETYLKYLEVKENERDRTSITSKRS